jgi:hypothetical protein
VRGEGGDEPTLRWRIALGFGGLDRSEGLGGWKGTGAVGRRVETKRTKKIKKEFFALFAASFWWFFFGFGKRGAEIRGRNVGGRT